MSIVVDQAYRRIVRKEAVPSSEKIVSLFESDTDILVKGFRDVAFGHKVMLTTGKSSMITSLSILDGNPKDSTLVHGALTEHVAVFGAPPTLQHLMDALPPGRTGIMQRRSELKN